MQDINHQVLKALVENNPKHTLFVLEDLKGIRNATEHVRTKDRSISVSWSFTKRNKINLLLLKLILAIRAKPVLVVNTLKRRIVIKRYTCLLVKTVATNPTMTELEL